MAQKKGGGRTTKRGFGAMDALAPDAELPPAPAVVVPMSAPLPSLSTSIELEDVREVGTPALLAGPWRAVEIWTQNRIYGLDASMVCTEVTDRTTGQAAPDHPALTARLVGGQRREEDGRIREVSHPLPGIGAAAVFARDLGKRMHVSETSAVTRVVFRQRVVELADGALSWEELAKTVAPGAQGRKK